MLALHLSKKLPMFTNNKIFFRFILLFFGLMIFPFPLYYLPYVSVVSEWMQSFYEMVIPWIGNTMFGIEGEVNMNGRGSGDTTGDYLIIFFFFCVAVVGTIIWTIIERKNKDYTKLNYWFITCLRYFVGAMMLSYGMIKVIQLQFPEPGFFRLLEPYGQSSPMGLAWTYMGFSSGFNIFVGLGEVIGGILLFHRRTVIMGGIILLSVTSNIVAVNMFFDVPVKIFSVQLLVMTVIILGAHYKRLANVIFNVKNTEPYQYLRVFKKKSWHIAHQSIKWIFVAYLLFSNIDGKLERRDTYGSNKPKPALYGLFETVDFIKNSDTIPPLLTDTDRWRYMIIEDVRNVKLLDVNIQQRWYKQDSIDVIKKTLQFSSYRDSTEVHQFNYVKTDSTMTINGIFKCDTLKINFKRKTKEDFLLTNRGFNWINEYPLNR